MASRRLDNVAGRYNSSLNAGITTLINMPWYCLLVSHDVPQHEIARE
jgi:hypothetical protein